MKERFKKITVLIMEINRYIHKIKTEEMSEFDLKSPHVSCLFYLYKAGELTAKELCDISKEDKASVSRSIEYLETNGFISCNSTTKKRYKAILTLTEKGREIGAALAKKIDAILEQASVGLSEENRAVMYETLSLIHDNLENICNKYEG